MRLTEIVPEVSKLKISEDQAVKLLAWVNREMEDGLSARYPQEQAWLDNLRQYGQVPLTPVRNIPVENSPNYEVPLGAEFTDSMYAQILDLIFNIQPVLTVKPVEADGYPERKDAADALQRHVNWGVGNEWDLRTAANETLLDDVKLGTGVFYIPFVEAKKKTRVSTVTQRGPLIQTLSVEDFIMPGGDYGNIQRARWCAMRWYLDQTTLMDQADEEDWDIDGVQAVGMVSWVRNRRELLGKSWRSHITPELYEIWRIWCYFDIDDDGIDEDLLVTWDRTSRRIVKIEYNGYDHRPFSAARYQIQGHLFYGIGVMQMVATFEQEASDIHSYAVANALLANCRFWKAKDGSMPETMKVWPSKVQMMNDPADLDAVAMADIYPSMLVMQQFPLTLASRRVGGMDMISPKAIASSRTPGITAMSLMQQQNKRFTPAFDEARLAIAEAVRQCLYREQERLLSGDDALEKHLIKVHGEENGVLLINTLKDRDFDEAYAIELTASSTTLNRDVERQNAILLINLLGQYYQKVLELVAIVANPQTPEAVRDAAKKIAEAAGSIVYRTLSTFDSVRDPKTFIVDVSDDLEKASDTAQLGMTGIQQLMAGLMGQAPQGGAQPGGVSVG